MISKYEKKELKKLIHEILVRRDQMCLKCFTTEKLQASHIYSVGRYKKLEYDPDNIIFLCLYHHLYWWHKEPKEAWEWIETTLPKQRLDRLKLRTQQTGKGMQDYKMLKVFLQNELSKLKGE